MSQIGDYYGEYYTTVKEIYYASQAVSGKPWYWRKGAPFVYTGIANGATFWTSSKWGAGNKNMQRNNNINLQPGTTYYFMVDFTEWLDYKAESNSNYDINHPQHRAPYLISTTEYNDIRESSPTLAYADSDAFPLPNYTLTLNPEFANAGWTDSTNIGIRTVSKKRNSTFNIPYTPKYASHNFKGWATKSGGKVVYADKASITLNADTTLYAVWERKKIEVTLDFNGGILKENGKELKSKTIKVDYGIDTNMLNGYLVEHPDIKTKTAYSIVYYNGSTKIATQSEYSVLRYSHNCWQNGQTQYTIENFVINVTKATTFKLLWSSREIKPVIEIKQTDPSKNDTDIKTFNITFETILAAYPLEHKELCKKTAKSYNSYKFIAWEDSAGYVFHNTSVIDFNLLDTTTYNLYAQFEKTYNSAYISTKGITQEDGKFLKPVGEVYYYSMNKQTGEWEQTDLIPFQYEQVVGHKCFNKIKIIPQGWSLEALEKDFICDESSGYTNIYSIKDETDRLEDIFECPVGGTFYAFISQKFKDELDTGYTIADDDLCIIEHPKENLNLPDFYEYLGWISPTFTKYAYFDYISGDLNYLGEAIAPKKVLAKTAENNQINYYMIKRLTIEGLPFSNKKILKSTIIENYSKNAYSWYDLLYRISFESSINGKRIFKDISSFRLINSVLQLKINSTWVSLKPENIQIKASEVQNLILALKALTESPWFSSCTVVKNYAINHTGNNPEVSSTNQILNKTREELTLILATLDSYVIVEDLSE